MTHLLPGCGVSAGHTPVTDVGGSAVVFMPGMLSRGGAERYAAALASVLSELGLNVTLATTELDSLDPVADYFDVDLSRVRLLPLHEPRGVGRRLPDAVRHLWRDASWATQIGALRPDFVFNSLYKSELTVPSARNFYLCHFPHRRDLRLRGARKRYVDAVAAVRSSVFGRFPRNQERVIANSHFTADAVLLRWGRRADVIFPPCPTMGVGEVPAKDRAIIAVGRYAEPIAHIPNKRFDVLVDTFRSATDLHEAGWSLRIAGSSDEAGHPYIDRLRELAGDAPITFHVNVEFETLVNLYRSAELYWHAQGYGEEVREYPEAHEHFGMSVVEAMSAGCIPIVHRSAGPAEVVSALPEDQTWGSVQELLERTRAATTMPADQRHALAQVCAARAAEFGMDTFRARVRDLMSAALK